MAIIRQEYGDDFEDIRNVIEEAFNQPDEAELVEALRHSGDAIIGLVSEEDREIVGHAMLSKASIDGSEAKIAGLAPVAVKPEFQNNGIGSLLIREALDECLSLGYDAVIVIGTGDFYPRFGFKPASEYGIASQWDGIPPDHFMVLELHADALEGISGTARYAPAFDDIV
jgi:putative acetyltransferase